MKIGDKPPHRDAAPGQRRVQERRHRGARVGQGRARRGSAARPVAEDDQAAPGIGRALRQGRAPGARRAGAGGDRDHLGAICPSRCRIWRRAPPSRRWCTRSTRQSLKDMGRTMAALKERFAGKMDFSKASATVKKLLSGGAVSRDLTVQNKRQGRNTREEHNFGNGSRGRAGSADGHAGWRRRTIPAGRSACSRPPARAGSATSSCARSGKSCASAWASRS